MIPALIPARGGSKGIPGKNIALVQGYPLLSYSIVACQECPEISEIYVSSDCPEILTTALLYGCNTIHRPSDLAQDRSTDYDVLKHFFAVHPRHDMVAYMRPTTPLRTPLTIARAIEKIEKWDEDITGLRSMHEAAEGPYKMMKMGKDGLCEGFFPDFQGERDYTNLPRQTFPTSYLPNGYIDIALRYIVEELGTDFGLRALPFVTDPVIEIDTHHQMMMLQCYLKLYGDRTLDILRAKYSLPVEES